MSRTMWTAALLALPCPALACSLCGGDLQTRATLRQEVAKAQVIVVGKLTNPRLSSTNLDGGTTDLVIETVLKDHAILKGKTKLTLARYLPVDEKSPRHLLLADVVDGKLDVLSGRPITDERLLDYLQSVIRLNEPDGAKRLIFYFRYIDSPVAEVAADAYVEFAKSTDAEVTAAAKHLDADRLRKLVRDPALPAPQLGLFAYLLAACGKDADANLLLATIKADTPRTQSALRGLLAGYIALRPKDGWPMVTRIVSDPKRPFLDRYAALGVARFFQNGPSDVRAEILKVMKAGVEQGDLAEIPVEDLRRWGWWDLTDSVLAQFDKKSHDFPMVRRAIVRYALMCPKPEAAKFIAALRKQDAEFVAGVEESLQD